MRRQIDQFADLHPSGFDFVLTGLSGVMTAYSVGMSVGNTIAGNTFIVLTLLGTWISFALVKSWRSPKLIRLNGFLYTAGVLSAFFLARPLCEMFPDNPFKAQIFVCGALCWMLVFGSFLVWSDQTLLFQSVPSIAAFGLVGCYDTYRNATWFFFGFLLCFATILARAHGRTMLRQAKESGYSQSGDRMDRSATELERMRSGPWKWVAGPQWALASAFVVILFSMIGAPIIRESVQGVAANVRVNGPVNSSRASTIGGSDSSVLRVNSGPLQISSLPVLRATLDLPRYLRSNIYQVYAPTGWTSQSSLPVGDRADAVFRRSMDRKAIATIKTRQEITFDIEPLTSRFSDIPTPGEVIEVDPIEGIIIKLDGTLSFDRTKTINLIRGRSVVASPETTPSDALSPVPEGMENLTDTHNIDPKVFELANQVTAKGRTDYERATLIKSAIEQRAKYNLLAEATPAGADPVEHFLFKSREGYCTLFASSMVLMARSVGIPARLVSGYFPFKGELDGDHRYVIRDSDRHAWAELFFKDAGWVVFDATEGAEMVPGGELGSSNTSALDQNRIVKTAIDILIGIGVIGLIGFSIWTLRRQIKLGPAKSDLDREYLRFVEVLQRATGKVRQFDQTPAEYLAAVSPSLDGAGDLAAQINARFESLMYSPETPTRESLTSLRNDVKRLKSDIKRGPPR
ncbi:MAG: transglutaminase domain-containing protein [Fimbriimonadaceae bacterium]|nr:transglutaminase domain-containing protein [Fimbriimonadaceae bacterium]